MPATTSEKQTIKITTTRKQNIICPKDNNMVVEAMQIQSYHHKPTPLDTNNHQMDYSKIGRTVRSALMKAQTESRVIVGLTAAIKVLSKAPEGSLFCLMAVPQAGDSATHMHEVLLEAFCYENDIYVIKVDCPIKLSRILGKTTVESCCLVQKTWTGEQGEEQLNKSESMLVDFCEAYWDATENPVVQLPNVWRPHKPDKITDFGNSPYEGNIWIQQLLDTTLNSDGDFLTYTGERWKRLEIFKLYLIVCR